MCPVSAGGTLRPSTALFNTGSLARPLVTGLSDGLSRGLIRAHARTGFGDFGTRAENAILTFHGVGEDPAVGIRENVSTAQFRETIARLAEVVEFVPLSAVTAESDRRRVAVTFDDGLGSVYENALPVLREFDVPATVFVNPRFVGDRDPETFAARHQVDRARGVPLSDEQLGALAASSLISIGNHSLTHRDLTAVTDEAELRREVVAAQRILAERYGVDAGAFSFPYGAYDERVASLVAETHERSVTTTPGLVRTPRSPDELPRLNGNHPLDRLRWELTPAGEFLHRLRSPWRDTTSGPEGVG